MLKLARYIIVFGLLFWALVRLTKDSFRWPALIADNITYIFLFLMFSGYALLCAYYIKAKNPKKAWELIIMAATIVVFFLLVKLIS